MEVLPDRVDHIEYVSSEPELFYEPTGLEKTPMPLPEGEGRVVYYNPAPKDAYFIRSRVGGNRNGCVTRSVKLTGPDDTTLIFESRFECGNLYKAVQVSEYEYELYLHYDLYTKKHTQWYYFRVQNARTGVRYRFTIVNLMKPGSLYNQGMKPLFYSEFDAAHNKVGWKRWGNDIKYYKNNIRRTNMKGDKSYYSLTWTSTFPRNNDLYYFAHCYPYTYTDLQKYLLNVQNDPVRSRFCKQRVLCRTLAGNLIYVLTITSPSINPQHAKSKRAVVLTARVHPGETPASWMMKGFLDYLTGDTADAKLLRDTFVFKVIPMLNPDGVVVGNYRCSLAGRDLNRNYKSVLKDSFPSVCHCKVLIKKLMEERDVVVYCDLHGHSRKQNVFIYGCENRHDQAKRFRERIFPYILNKNAPEKFSFESCKFKVQKSKDGTGRVVMWQMGIMNSYTMEATFCGTSLGNKHHFSTKEYESLGYHFCDSLLDYCDPDNSKCAQILCRLEEKVRQEILAHLRYLGSPLPEDRIVNLDEDYTSAVESSTSGSDSSVDDGLPVHLLAMAPKLQKKKKLKTRKERDKKRNASDKYGNEKTESPSAEKEGSASKKDDRTNAPKVIHYQHLPAKDTHSAGRLSYSRHDSSGTHSAMDDKGIKKTEYLEALTNAYIRNGLLPQSEKDMPTFRYTAGVGQRGWSNMPASGNVEGLCPHHEKTFAAQYVANHLSDLQFADDHYEWGNTTKSTEDFPSRGNSSQQRSRPSTRQHVVALSAVQQRQQDMLQLQQQINSPASVISYQSRPSTGRGSPIKTHPSPFDEQLDKEYTDFVKRGFSAKTRSSNSRPTSRCPSATQISYPQYTRQEQPVQEQYQRQLLQLHQQHVQQQVEDDMRSRRSSKHGQTGSKTSVGDYYGPAGTNRFIRKSGRVSRTGNYSVDSEIMHSEIERSERGASRSASTTSDVSVNDDDDQQSLQKHTSHTPVGISTTSKTATDTNPQPGKQCAAGGTTDRYPSQDSPNQTPEKMEPDKVKRSSVTISKSLDTHPNYTPSFNKGSDVNITKIITSESSSKITPHFHCTSEGPTLPERSMGSSHHFRRAESLTQCTDTKSLARRTSSSQNYLNNTSPEHDRIDEDMATGSDDPRSLGNATYRPSKTPLVAESSTISLTLGDKIYSNYDRFASVRKKKKVPTATLR